MKPLKPAVLILIAFLSACEVHRYVNVPVNYAAKLYFNSGPTVILLINQFDFNKTRINNKRKLNVIKDGCFAAVKYAETLLKQLPGVNVINLVDSANFSVNTDSVKLLALKYHANYVLSFSNFDADIILSDIQNPFVYFNTNVAVTFILYERSSVNSKELNGTADDLQTESANLGLVATSIIYPTVKGNKGSIIASAQHATQAALQDYFSYSVSHLRPLYVNSYFQPAVKEIFAGNFKKADNLLQPFLIDKNKKVASRAAYNLAVVYEAEGEIDSAIYMARQSLGKYRALYATDILDDLKME